MFQIHSLTTVYLATILVSYNDLIITCGDRWNVEGSYRF